MKPIEARLDISYVAGYLRSLSQSLKQSDPDRALRIQSDILPLLEQALVVIQFENFEEV